MIAAVALEQNVRVFDHARDFDNIVGNSYLTIRKTKTPTR